MEQKIWQIKINGKPKGNFSIEELLQNGLTTESFVRRLGMENWQPAKEIPEMIAAFNLIKMRNEIEIDIFKYVADENDEIRLQIEQLEKSHAELQEGNSEYKKMLKDISEKEAELRTRFDSLKKENEELPNLQLKLTQELKAVGNENIALRKKLKGVFSKLLQGVTFGT